MFDIFNIFAKNTDPTKETIANFLKTSPEALDAFEKSYWKEQDAKDQTSDNFFKQNNRLLIQANKHSKPELTDQAVILAETITNELLSAYGYSDIQDLAPVTKDVLESLPTHLRPQLSANFMQKDMAQDSYLAIIDNYKRYKEAKNPKEAFTNPRSQGCPRFQSGEELAAWVCDSTAYFCEKHNSSPKDYLNNP